MIVLSQTSSNSEFFYADCRLPVYRPADWSQIIFCGVVDDTLLLESGEFSVAIVVSSSIPTFRFGEASPPSSMDFFGKIPFKRAFAISPGFLVTWGLTNAAKGRKAGSTTSGVSCGSSKELFRGMSEGLLKTKVGGFWWFWYNYCSFVELILADSEA